MKRSFVFLLAGVGFSLSQAQTVLTASSWVGPTHTLTLAQKEWCDVLEQKTTGKVKCNILPRAPTAAPGTYDAVKSGVLDLSFTVHGYTHGRFVLTQMTDELVRRIVVETAERLIREEIARIKDLPD